MIRELNNEKGVALITALLVLAILTMLGLAATLVSSVDMQISGNEKIALQGQYAAEAGISQAIVMMNSSTIAGVIRTPAPEPTWGQTSNWRRSVKSNVTDPFFNFSTTVSYKIINLGGGDRVAFFNRSSGFSSAPTGSGGWPVYEIRSVASRGDYLTQESILELTRNSYNFWVRGGFTAAGPIELRGNPTVDGQHHDENGDVVTTGSGCRSGTLSQGMPAVFANGSTTTAGAGSAVTYGNSSGSDTVDSRLTSPPQTPPTTPWGAMNMDYDNPSPATADFVSIFPNPPVEYSPGSSLTDNRYYRDDAAPNFANENITGNGLLILHNPQFEPPNCPACGSCTGACAPAVLDANGGTYRGVIIADQVSLRGNVTVIGALISLSTIETQATGAGNPTILYSCQAIERFAGGQINRKLNWRRE